MQPAQLIARVASWITSRDDGQGLAEYALILSLIAIIAIVAVMFMGNQVSGAFDMIGESVDSVT